MRIHKRPALKINYHGPFDWLYKATEITAPDQKKHIFSCQSKENSIFSYFIQAVLD